MNAPVGVSFCAKRDPREIRVIGTKSMDSAALSGGSMLGSDALLMKSRLREADDAGLEQIEFPASVHLAFDQLQLADLPFRLAVGPRLRDCRRHGGLILRDPVGESGNEAAF